MDEKEPLFVEKFPIVMIEAEDNTEKLPEILKKLRINDEELVEELQKAIENHRNCNEIIDILDKLTEMLGCTDEVMNRYKLYTINRDLMQLDSPIWSEPNEWFCPEFPMKTEKETVWELFCEYDRLLTKVTGKQEVRVMLFTKRNVEKMLIYLKDRYVIHYFKWTDIYESELPVHMPREWNDLLQPGHEIEITRVL